MEIGRGEVLLSAVNSEIAQKVRENGLLGELQVQHDWMKV